MIRGVMEQRAMAENKTDSKAHPGITMHKLTVGAGFEGLVFTVGSALIFLFGLPSLWYFVAFSAALGVGIAVVFRLINKGRSERLKPLSILSHDTVVSSPAPAKDSESKNPADNMRRSFPSSLPWRSSPKRTTLLAPRLSRLPLA
jgi:hypothetical protein